MDAGEAVPPLSSPASGRRRYAAVVELILVRHGLPVRREGGAGPADPPLADVGAAQAQALAAWLTGEPLDAVYSSPLLRARETAAPLSASSGLEVIVREDLAEWDRDSTSYLPLEELKQAGHPDWHVLANRDWDAMPVDVFAFRDRVVTEIDAIAAAHPSERVVVVCHGGVINAYTSDVLGLEDPLFFDPRYTGFSRILVSSGGVRSIATLNESPHLRSVRT